jgi:hypothetical protein
MVTSQIRAVNLFIIQSIDFIEWMLKLTEAPAARRVRRAR